MELSFYGESLDSKLPIKRSSRWCVQCWCIAQLIKPKARAISVRRWWLMQNTRFYSLIRRPDKPEPMTWGLKVQVRLWKWMQWTQAEHLAFSAKNQMVQSQYRDDRKYQPHNFITRSLASWGWSHSQKYQEILRWFLLNAIPNYTKL